MMRLEPLPFRFIIGKRGKRRIAISCDPSKAKSSGSGRVVIFDEMKGE